MSIENPSVVDAIGVERDSGKVVLTISDHFDWSDEHGHLLALQAKINTYVRFIESGEIDETYPAARGRERVIDVVARHRPTREALAFVRTSAAVLREAMIELRTRVVEE